MRIVKRLLIIATALLVILQFIRPEKNKSESDPKHDIVNHLHPPLQMENVLRTSCYDCHSNVTRYPWYAEVQPIGWWLAGHIKDAQAELNFSDFGGYKPRRQYRKLDEMITQIQEGGMPLPSYLIIHTDARLSREQKDMFVAWANSMRDTMKAHYPLDSLVRRQ